MADNSLDREWGDLRPTADDSQDVARIKEVQFSPPITPRFALGTTETL